MAVEIRFKRKKIREKINTCGVFDPTGEDANIIGSRSNDSCIDNPPRILACSGHMQTIAVMFVGILHGVTSRGLGQSRASSEAVLSPRAYPPSLTYKRRDWEPNDGLRWPGQPKLNDVQEDVIIKGRVRGMSQKADFPSEIYEIESSRRLEVLHPFSVRMARSAGDFERAVETGIPVMLSTSIVYMY
ncbi:predicted protein [Uncinocarpus reesii 1704]|uniref:Uncharacterized protein n=1 Tax=Uncinocarpus reesii (strain UAMH 1704) TaxID=336963 RepID=C4JPG0_UNCRE|nr:uncharacterized protein UREG_04542 [Uncinocarpus reesii 1704]EEP79696.1 predicted protein [Uncinocarpus reesii 1704]